MIVYQGVQLSFLVFYMYIILQEEKFKKYIFQTLWLEKSRNVS